MKKSTKMAIIATTLLAGAGTYGAVAYADGREGCAWKKGGHHSMMRGGGMGFFGMGPGEDRNFSADEIRTLAEAFLLMRGNENLKVGEITPTENESYMVRIVTQDDSLVREVEVSKKNGRPMHKMNKRADASQ